MTWGYGESNSKIPEDNSYLYQQNGHYGTTDVFDFTEFNTMYIDWSIVGYSGYNLGVVGIGTTRDNSTFAAKIDKSSTFSRKQETLDISSITGSYYAKTWNFYGVYIYNWWFE